MSANDDRPWTEEQWYRFMQRSEARAARYAELLETWMDQPDRDALIAREMGWNFEAAEDGAPELQPDERNAIGSDATRADDESTPLQIERPLHDCESIPAYVLARKTGMAVWQALKPYLEGTDSDAADPKLERLQSAQIHALIPAAKIAGGHAMGTDEDVLGGHIVCCRRALEAAQTARDDLRWLGDHQHLPAAVSDELTHRLDQVIEAIEQRLREFRSRVWW